MKNFMKYLFMSISIVLILGFINLYGFCVYNNTDIIIDVDQYGGGIFMGQFNAILKPGEKACCNWKNKTCNRSGKRDALLKFDVGTEPDPNFGHNKTICNDFKILAGGALVVEGKNGNYHCVGYGY